MSDETAQPKKKRTQDEILQAIMDGHLDQSEVKVCERVELTKTDMSGDVPVVIETVIFENGVQVEVRKGG
jgi:hypothetical protein